MEWKGRKGGWRGKGGVEREEGEGRRGSERGRVERGVEREGDSPTDAEDKAVIG